MEQNILNIISDNIENNLKQMNELYIKLLNICQKENKQIINEDLKGLAETIIEKESLLQNLNNYKADLKTNIEKLKVYYGYKINEYVPFSRLIDLFETYKKEFIKKLKENIEENLIKIKNISVINKKLINDSMSFINYVINFLKNSESEIEIYSKTGQKKKNINELNFLDITL